MPETAWPALQKTDARGGSPDAHRNDAYFALIRNFRRHAWLPCFSSVLRPRSARASCRAQPRCRYSTTALCICPTPPRCAWAGSATRATRSRTPPSPTTTCELRRLAAGRTHPVLPAYEKIGVKVDDQYRQLSTSLLQIENEFYGTIRPKRPVGVRRTPAARTGCARRRLRRGALCRSDPVPAGRRRTVSSAPHRRLSALLPAARQPADTPAEAADWPTIGTPRPSAGVRPTWTSCVAARNYASSTGVARCSPHARHRRQHSMRRTAAARPRSAERGAGDARRPCTHALGARAADSRPPRESRVPISVLPVARASCDAARAAARSRVAARYAQMAEQSHADQRAIKAADDLPFEDYRRNYLDQELMAARSCGPSEGPPGPRTGRSGQFSRKLTRRARSHTGYARCDTSPRKAPRPTAARNRGARARAARADRRAARGDGTRPGDESSRPATTRSRVRARAPHRRERHCSTPSQPVGRTARIRARRIAEDVYGTCIDCTEAIGELAWPANLAARRCTACPVPARKLFETIRPERAWQHRLAGHRACRNASTLFSAARLGSAGHLLASRGIEEVLAARAASPPRRQAEGIRRRQSYQLAAPGPAASDFAGLALSRRAWRAARRGRRGAGQSFQFGSSDSSASGRGTRSSASLIQRSTLARCGWGRGIRPRVFALGRRPEEQSSPRHQDLDLEQLVM